MYVRIVQETLARVQSRARRDAGHARKRHRKRRERCGAPSDRPVLCYSRHDGDDNDRCSSGRSGPQRIWGSAGGGGAQACALDVWGDGGGIIEWERWRWRSMGGAKGIRLMGSGVSPFLLLYVCVFPLIGRNALLHFLCE